MIRIAVCDDSEYMRKETCRNILEYSFERDFEYSIDEYSTGERLLSSQKEYDLIFMDYQFEGLGADGITIAKKIREKNKAVTIMFLSSYPNVVFQSFEVGTFRFLVKPIEKDKFRASIDSFLNAMEEDDVLAVKIDGTKHFIKQKTILYIEGFGKYCIIHFDNPQNDLECHETMGAVEERLSRRYFFRCYKSFVVNLGHVSSFNHSEVIMDNGDNLLISRAKYREFMSVYSDFIAK
ncbi:MAG: response regulator transcription factor [Lachnospiraceae bacterium]|nr:response regulator transcription factor [Lachnospiraceae bacterium]